LVFIRVRKPCVFERRRRFGWNVRLGMKNPALLSSTTANEWRKSINDSGRNGKPQPDGQSFESCAHNLTIEVWAAETVEVRYRPPRRPFCQFSVRYRIESLRTNANPRSVTRPQSRVAQGLQQFERHHLTKIPPTFWFCSSKNFRRKDFHKGKIFVLVCRSVESIFGCVRASSWTLLLCWQLERLCTADQVYTRASPATARKKT